MQEDYAMNARTFTVEQAARQFPELMEMAAEGQEVVILQENRPAARLVPIRSAGGPRQFGQYHGQIQIADDFDEPLADGFWLGETA